METEGKYKLLMIRTRFLKNTLELSKEIFQKAYVSFMEDLSNRVNETKRPTLKKEEEKTPPENGGLAKEERVNLNPEPEEKSAPKEKKEENLKQVFRKIASEIHPDKLENIPEFEKKYKTNLFEKARIALEENDYYAIVEVAEELNMTPPPPNKKQIEMMKSKNLTLEREINKIENSLVWAWYHGGRGKKKMLMEKYIDHLEKQQSSRT